MRTVCLALVLLCGGCASGGSGDWPLRAELYPATVDSPPKQAIIVATYNLNHHRSPDAIRKILAQVAADIWFFQEAGDEADLRSLLPDGDHWNVALVRVNPGEAQAIASRLPITKTEAWPLASSRRRRCALAAWTRLGDRELLLINTDHEPGYFTFHIAHQAQLNSLTDQIRSQTSPCIVGGDFNTCGNFWRFRSSQSDALAARNLLREAGFQAATTEPQVTFSTGPVRGYLDEIYVRDLAVADAHILRDAAGSDHRPLVARVSLITP